MDAGAGGSPPALTFLIDHAIAAEDDARAAAAAGPPDRNLPVADGGAVPAEAGEEP
jgi:hypothetical protein